MLKALATPNLHLFPTALLLAAIAAAAQETPAAKPPKPPKYPLHLHIIAADEFHRTIRMQPTAGIAPSGEGGMSIPDFSNGDPGGGGGNGGPFGGDDDFTGSGRADLVSPPVTTQGLTFKYEGCPRIRVLAGFTSLPARWKKPGQKLEVLLPTDDVSGGDKPQSTEKCTLTVTLHDLVYLRMRTGAIIQVSQADYWKRPVLRKYMSGPMETLQKRPARAENAAKVTPPQTPR